MFLMLEVYKNTEVYCCIVLTVFLEFKSNLKSHFILGVHYFVRFKNKRKNVFGNKKNVHNFLFHNVLMGPLSFDGALFVLEDFCPRHTIDSSNVSSKLVLD